MTTKPKTTQAVTTRDVSYDSDASYTERVRNNVDTTDTNAIMGRFFNAVSWR